MAKLNRTIQGRLEAFNSQSRLEGDLRILLKFIDGKREWEDLQKALKPHICTREKLQKLVNMGLVTQEGTAIDVETSSKFGGLAYFPTIPAALPFATAKPDNNPAPQTNDALDMPEYALLEAKECIGDFLLRYAPQSAFSILVEIEDIQSMAQLRASLIAYEQLIRHTDVFGQKHMRDLRKIIAQAEAAHVYDASSALLSGR